MPRTPTYDEQILKLLKKGSLTGKELKEHLKVAGDSQRKSFNESLIRLLKKYTYIKGYDHTYDERQRPQAFVPDPFIFSLVTDNPLEIRNLFEELVSSDTEKMNHANSILNIVFRNKIREIESINKRKWKKLQDRVYSRELKDEELLWYHAEQTITNDKKLLSLMDIHAPNDIVRDVMNSNRENLPKIKEDNPNLKIYLLKDDKVNRDIDDALPQSIKENYLFSDISLEKDDVLSNFYPKPMLMTVDEIEMLFYEVTSWIRSREKDKNKYLECFAVALSSMQKSKENLDELVHKINGKHLFY